MLEMGPQGPALHASLKDAVLATGADADFPRRPGHGLARGSARKSAASPAMPMTSTTFRMPILASLAYGDAVMVKGSKGVRLAGLVKAIREKFA